MLSRFSVKKPYTVVVAVVLVLILGVVSFTKMNTDLLPSMNLPYAIVMTTYPGASPEAVEEAVTKPIEQSMATVSNIKNVSSVSRENVSMVILEFGETTNMDSVTLEMRENLDQIKGYWDDTVGNPIIMKLNPDMMPIIVVAADVEGKVAGIEEDLVELLGKWGKKPITYAGGIAGFDDIDKLQKAGHGNLDFTIGSALDIFGGRIKYRDVINYIRKEEKR